MTELTDREVGPDGKPIPTQEEIDTFLSACETPFIELWDAMVHKATVRAYKGAWRGRSTILQVWDRIHEELSELQDEIFEPSLTNLKDNIDYQKVLHECADVANFLVVIQDLVKEHLENDGKLT